MAQDQVGSEINQGTTSLSGARSPLGPHLKQGISVKESGDFEKGEGRHIGVEEPGFQAHWGSGSSCWIEIAFKNGNGAGDAVKLYLIDVLSSANANADEEVWSLAKSPRPPSTLLPLLLWKADIYITAEDIEGYRITKYA